MKTNRFYTFTFLLCLTGYVWIFFEYNQGISTGQTHVSVCLIKNVSGLPCPSCGCTRSVLSIIDGRHDDALNMNPLGYLMIIFLLLIPVWMLFDMMTKRRSLYKSFEKIEYYLKMKRIAIPTSLVILMIWIRNIMNDI